MEISQHESEKVSVSLRMLFARFRWRIIATWLLVVAESGLMLMFPLLIGIAVDGLLQQSYHGVYLLGLVGGLTVVSGAVRRAYDTRLYSRVYTSAAEQIVARERKLDTKVSVIAARTNMAK